MTKQQPPSPVPQFWNSERKKKNGTPKASPLNIVTHLNSKATAGTKQSERSLYSKNKSNVQSKEKNGCNRFKGSKGEDSEDLPAGLTVLFSAEDEMKPSEVCFLYSPLFSANNTRMQNRKLPLFTVFFTLPLLCFFSPLCCVFFCPLLSVFLLCFCSLFAIFCSPFCRAC